MKNHLAKVKLLHEQDCKHGFGEVWLPYALSRKYPNANKEWKWQYVFPSTVISSTREDGKPRRHHTSESTIQKTVGDALKKAKINKHGNCHTLRHSWGEAPKND